MKRRVVLVAVSFVALLLVLATGLSLAEDRGNEAGLNVDAGALAPVADAIPIQGQLTDAGGNPLEGNYSITGRLYDGASGPLLCSDTDMVSVSNGLFTFYLDSCTNSAIDGRQLSVTFQVGGDPETARVNIYTVPYARTLRPGAVISNTSTSRGLQVLSRGGGQAGTALWAENVGSSGIAVWGVARGTDATIIASNTGTGLLFKGFGADGGEDEFRVNNDGAIESKADSYVFVSGLSALKDADSDLTRMVRRDNGSVEIYSGNAGGGVRLIEFPIVLPAVLYGQPVKVKNITVFYVCKDGSKGYVTHAWVFKQTDADSALQLLTDGTDRTSTAASSFDLTPTSNNVLSATQGILNVAIRLQFADDTNYVRIGGLRFQLGHHDLY